MTFLARHDRLVGILWRLFVAVACCTLAFWLGTSPTAPNVLGMPLGTALWRILDAPVSVINAVLPVWAKTSAASSASFQVAPTLRRFELLRYIAVGIPGYLAVLYLPMAAQVAGRKAARLEANRGA